jgi:ribose/xylose/arabinose/galactoside ABC-type transport system permease subunit
MAGLSGIVALAFFTLGDPQSGGGIALFAVAGAVIGGTPLAGARPRSLGRSMGRCC